jgi:hypothetical protein
MLKPLQGNAYANIVSTLALVIAVGTGGAVAASKLDGGDIQKRALTGAHLKSNTVGGRVVKEKSLKPVPRARNAARLGGDPAESFRVHCPLDMVPNPVSDVCFEKDARPPAPYSSAAVACEITDNKDGAGRRLPTHAELMTAIGDFGMTLASGGELTNSVWASSSTPGAPLNVLYIIDGAGGTAVTSDTAAGAKAFRCVADPLN